MYKVCSICNKSKLEIEFGSKYGKYISKCLECIRIYSKEWYSKNKEKHIDNVTQQRDDIRQMIRDCKDKPCVDCKIKYPYFVMDFDHRTDKSFNISDAYRRRGRLQIIDEIAKCDVVCANCHRIRTQNRLKLT